MKITVKTAKERKELDIDTSATVDQLKSQIADSFGASKEQLTLVYAGKLLKNPTDALSKFGIKDGQSMSLAIKAAKPKPAPEKSAEKPDTPKTGPKTTITVTIKAPGKSKDFELNPQDSVKELRQRTSKFFTAPEEDVLLLYAGKMLKDEDTLSASGLTDGKDVNLVVKSKKPKNPPSTSQTSSGSRGPADLMTPGSLGLGERDRRAPDLGQGRDMSQFMQAMAGMQGGSRGDLSAGLSQAMAGMQSGPRSDLSAGLSQMMGGMGQGGSRGDMSAGLGQMMGGMGRGGSRGDMSAGLGQMMAGMQGGPRGDVSGGLSQLQDLARQFGGGQGQGQGRGMAGMAGINQLQALARQLGGEQRGSAPPATKPGEPTTVSMDSLMQALADVGGNDGDKKSGSSGNQVDILKGVLSQMLQNDEEGMSQEEKVEHRSKQAIKSIIQGMAELLQLEARATGILEAVGLADLAKFAGAISQLASTPEESDDEAADDSKKGSKKRPTEEYALQLQQMHDMGFTNKAVNVQALVNTKGDTDKAIEIALQLQAAIEKKEGEVLA